MLEFFKLLRRRPGDHREVFAEFAVLMAFIVAEHLAATRDRPRLRVVR